MSRSQAQALMVASRIAVFGRTGGQPAGRQERSDQHALHWATPALVLSTPDAGPMLRSRRRLIRRGTVDFSKLSREDLMVAGGGLLLAIGLLAFPWFSVDGFTAAATSSTGGIWAVLALIVLVLVIIDLLLARWSPATAIPTSQLGREKTRTVAVGVVVVLVFIKLISHTGNYGWGFVVDLIVLVVVAAGAWLNAQGKSTPLNMTTTGDGTGTQA
jgi:hypothetical protein